MKVTWDLSAWNILEDSLAFLFPNANLPSKKEKQ